MIINFFYGDIQCINLFFCTYTVYNQLIKGNVHGRYLSRETNTNKTEKYDIREKKKEITKKK